MNPVTRRPEDEDASPMGSEYSSARTYLARHADLVRAKPEAEVPAHGSNDSDFVGAAPLTD